MTHEQKKFFEMLEKANISDKVKACWDKENLSLDTEEVENLMGCLSPSQLAMTKFFVELWLGGDGTVSIFTLSTKLDEQNKTIIQEWFYEPFFP
jgi:hypothetical protein